ncbi:hypothetical protein [Aneurinibacillus uraniidurans]|uniref:hypothetical protein n=1 Tax=Aneurinibacillus uraniidurans TaxID=2966586 RepID=UPI00234901D8|nr:hypothetical protein [Aneurinibacillus sp. B1]WCN37902.1 hypothetical protein PO771_00235 [Aneurinibacillus sp. B1]
MNAQFEDGKILLFLAVIAYTVNRIINKGKFLNHKQARREQHVAAFTRVALIADGDKIDLILKSKNRP